MAIHVVMEDTETGEVIINSRTSAIIYSFSEADETTSGSNFRMEHMSDARAIATLVATICGAFNALDNLFDEDSTGLLQKMVKDALDHAELHSRNATGE